MILKAANSAMLKTGITFDSLAEFYNLYKSENTVIVSQVLNTKTQKVEREAVPLSSVCFKIYLVTNSKTIEITKENVNTIDISAIDSDSTLSYAELVQIAADNNLSDYQTTDSDTTLRFYKLMDQLTNIQNQEKITATTNDSLKQELEKKQATIKKLLQNTENMQKYELKLQEQLKSCQDLNTILRSNLNAEYIKNHAKASTEEVKAFGKEFTLESDPGWTTRATNATTKAYLDPESVTSHKVVLPFNA